MIYPLYLLVDALHVRLILANTPLFFAHFFPFGVHLISYMQESYPLSSSFWGFTILMKKLHWIFIQVCKAEVFKLSAVDYALCGSYVVSKRRRYEPTLLTLIDVKFLFGRMHGRAEIENTLNIMLHRKDHRPNHIDSMNMIDATLSVRHKRVRNIFGGNATAAH